MSKHKKQDLLPEIKTMEGEQNAKWLKIWG